MARTIIVTKPEDADSTGLWIILLVAFAAVLIAIVGFNRMNTTRTVMVPAVTEQTTTTTTTGTQQ